MAIEFKGDLTSIGAGQLDYIKGVLQDHGFQHGEAEITPVGKDGDNYMAQVMMITITEGDRTFKMVAKIAPQLEFVRTMSNTPLMFNNENFMYTQILPKFQELQKMAGIPKEERFKYPTCYGSNSENMNEVILLEDLQTSEYVMLDRFTPFTDQCVREVLKTLAIFHSLSFALKHQEPATFTKMKSGLLDIWSLMSQAPEMIQSFELMELDAISMMESDRYKNAIKGIVRNVPINVAKLLKADEGSKHSVIRHGDTWTNNIMFKLSEDQVTDVMLIDYQVSKETSPACDLHYMIFNCTDYETRRKHFYDWIDYYHTELDKSLHNYGLKANFVYPKDQLDVDLKRYGRAMIGTSIVLSSVLIRKTEDATKMRETWEADQTQDTEQMMEAFKVSSLDKESVDIYKKKVEGLIDSFYDFGLL